MDSRQLVWKWWMRDTLLLLLFIFIRISRGHISSRGDTRESSKFLIAVSHRKPLIILFTVFNDHTLFFSREIIYVGLLQFLIFYALLAYLVAWGHTCAALPTGVPRVVFLSLARAIRTFQLDKQSYISGLWSARCMVALSSMHCWLLKKIWVITITFICWRKVKQFHRAMRHHGLTSHFCTRWGT